MISIETEVENTETENANPLERLNMKQTELLDSLYAITPEDNEAYFANVESQDVLEANLFLSHT